MASEAKEAERKRSAGNKWWELVPAAARNAHPPQAGPRVLFHPLRGHADHSRPGSYPKPPLLAKDAEGDGGSDDEDDIDDEEDACQQLPGQVLKSVLVTMTRLHHQMPFMTGLFQHITKLSFPLADLEPQIQETIPATAAKSVQTEAGVFTKTSGMQPGTDLGVQASLDLLPGERKPSAAAPAPAKAPAVPGKAVQTSLDLLPKALSLPLQPSLTPPTPPTPLKVPSGAALASSGTELATPSAQLSELHSPLRRPSSSAACLQNSEETLSFVTAPSHSLLEQPPKRSVRFQLTVAAKSYSGVPCYKSDSAESFWTDMDSDSEGFEPNSTAETGLGEVAAGRLLALCRDLAVLGQEAAPRVSASDALQLVAEGWPEPLGAREEDEAQLEPEDPASASSSVYAAAELNAMAWPTDFPEAAAQSVSSLQTATSAASLPSSVNSAYADEQLNELITPSLA